ncbi:MAG: hypothetical protein RIT81_34640 [Deltaproteobacteria bacterium]
MRRGAFILLSLVIACSGSPDRDTPGPTGTRDGGTRPPPLGADTLGDMCTAGCGADDDRKCSSGTADCALCLIDPDHVRITYCTQDCTADPCPTGWTCEPIKAFGQDQVTRACVADTAVCGDGVVQLGEVCDGDDPARGRCDACAGYVAVCGDGVVQDGEVCDGDDAQLGRCVDCARYESICGDGVVQSDEVCDGDSDVYCIDCTREEAPRVAFMVREVLTNGVRENGPNGTFYYGFAIPDGPAMFTLPADGDADGCGRAQILEATETYTRVALTICDADRWGRATWTLGFPRELVRYQNESEVPDAFLPTHEVVSMDGNYRLTWDRADVDRAMVSSFEVGAPAFTRGNITVRLSQSDPIASFAEARATLDLAFEILHPMR